MTSEHLRPRGYLGKAVSNESTVSPQFIHNENQELEREDQILALLLEAFPGVSIECLATAYARANRDPNIAAEILSEQTRTNLDKLPLKNSYSKSVETYEPPLPARDVLEEDINKDGVAMEINPVNNIVHSDDVFSKEHTHQLKNGHGDFAGASVWGDSPILDVQGGRPGSGSESRCTDHNGYPSLGKNNSIRRSKLSASAPIYEYQGTSDWTARFIAPVSAGTSQKLSAVTGSVSSQMQRRTSDTSGSGFVDRVTAERGMELEDGLYSGKVGKKKKKDGGGKVEEESGPEYVGSQRDKEEFVHSMFGGEFGIDVVRDILGDTDKALETLFNIGSTSSGIHCSGEADNVVGPMVSLLGDQDECNKDTKELPTAVPLEEIGLDTYKEELLIALCQAFPTVEQSFLAVVLQTAEFSYGGAVDILKDSGMTPVGEQIVQPKLDPAEVLKSLFRSNSEHQETSDSLNEQMVTATPWNVVAAKPRVRRSTVVQAVAEKLNFKDKGEWNEYERQRSSANEHWETMKMYLKEATMAYNQGDRLRAGLLSEKGAKFKQLAQEASQRASQNIFSVQNKDFENNITIDLHAQHVTEALQLLKLHLRSLRQIPSVHRLTIITGQGSHSAGGRARIKPALTKYLEQKQIPWKELNAGCILIAMSEVRGMDSNPCSDSSSDNES